MIKMKLGVGLVVCIVLLLSCMVAAQARVIYVDKDCSGTPNDGTSWGTAYLTIGAAVTTAEYNDELWIAEGTYTECVDTSTIGGVSLYGGFDGAETVRTERDPAANVTVIDGSNAGNAVKMSGGTVDGFVIQHGTTGIAVDGSTGYQAPTVISNNTLRLNGTGVSYQRCYYSILIGNNLMVNNRGRGVSGDPYTGQTYSAYIRDNVIARNGAGIYLFYSWAEIVNNTIVFNGGDYGISQSTVSSNNTKVINNIVAFNYAGLRRSGTGTWTVKNNCVYNPMSGTNYSGVSSGTNDIQVDPELVSTEYGEWHITTASACRNAGDDTAIQTGWLDIDGQARKEGACVDIGADESHGENRSASPITVRVKDSGSDSNDGSTWTLAKQTVKAAIEAATVQGGDVWVAEGTYQEKIDLYPGVYVYGGFHGDETALDQRDWITHTTTLNGNSSGSVVNVVAGQLNSRIDGFTITGGLATNGGGIFCDYASTTVANNIVTANNATYYGGGIYCRNSGTVIENNTVTENHVTTALSSYRGGGIYYDTTAGQGAITGNRITNNSASRGGGIYAGYYTGVINGNTVASNSSLTSGSFAGIYCTYGAPTLVNNTVVYNTDTAGYGGIACASTPNAKIYSNIVAFNNNGIAWTGSGISADYNDVYQNTGWNYYNGCTPGANDTSVDPLFVNGASGDYHLQSGSTCKGAGWNDAPGLPNIDMDGEARILPAGGIVDMGADEYATYDPVTNIADLASEADGAYISLADKVVNIGNDTLRGAFYVTEQVGPDGYDEGIKILWSHTTTKAEDMVTVQGVLGTVDGERVVTAFSVTSSLEHCARPVRMVTTSTELSNAAGRRVFSSGTVTAVLSDGYMLDTNGDQTGDIKLLTTGLQPGKMPSLSEGDAVFCDGVGNSAGEIRPGVVGILETGFTDRDGLIYMPTPNFTCAYASWAQDVAFHTSDLIEYGLPGWYVSGNGGLILVTRDIAFSWFDEFGRISEGFWNHQAPKREFVTAHEYTGTCEVGEVELAFGNSLIEQTYTVVDTDLGHFLDQTNREARTLYTSDAMHNGYYRFIWQVPLCSQDMEPRPLLNEEGLYTDWFLTLPVNNMLLWPYHIEEGDNWGVKVVHSGDTTTHVKVQLTDGLYSGETSVTAYLYSIPLQRGTDGKLISAAAVTVENQSNNSLVDIAIDGLAPGVYAYVVNADHGELDWNTQYNAEGSLRAFRDYNLFRAASDTDSTIGNLSIPSYIPPPYDEYPPYLQMGPFLNTIGCLNGMVEDLKVQAKVTNWSQPQPGGPVTVDLTYSIIDDSIMDPGRDASSCELMIYYPGPDHFYVPSQPPTMDRTIGEHSVSFTFTPDGTGTYYLLLHAMNSWGGYEKGHRNKPAVTNGVKGTYDGTTWTWQGSLF